MQVPLYSIGSDSLAGNQILTLVNFLSSRVSDQTTTFPSPPLAPNPVIHSGPTAGTHHTNFPPTFPGVQSHSGFPVLLALLHASTWTVLQPATACMLPLSGESELAGFSFCLLGFWANQCQLLKYASACAGELTSFHWQSPHHHSVGPADWLCTWVSWLPQCQCLPFGTGAGYSSHMKWQENGVALLYICSSLAQSNKGDHLVFNGTVLF